MKVLSIVTFSIFSFQWFLSLWVPSCLVLRSSFVVDAFGVEFASRRNGGPNAGINKGGHRALIYGEHGMTLEREEECIHHPCPSFAFLKDSLADQLDNTARLIRVACAFAPSPHNNMHPKQIHSATIVDVDSTEVQVALAIPQDGLDLGTCVQVLVPIPISCKHPNGNVLEGILQSMEQMDIHANILIGERELLQDRFDQIAQQELIRQELQEENVDSLPDWWTFAELKITLAEECDSLKVLLNDYDFAPTLKKLCQIHHSCKSLSISQVWEAKVASVGPSGVFLRAYATVGQGDESQCEIVDVPIRFSQTGLTADDVREYVLDLVESVEPVSEQVLSSSDDVVLDAATAITAPTETKSNIDKVPEDDTHGKIQAIAKARKQPKTPEEEAILAARYAAIADVGERAFCILKDLGMI